MDIIARVNKNPKAADLTAAVRAYAAKRWGASEVELAAEGMEYALFRISTAKGDFAVKAASGATISDDIDDAIDTNRSLAREAEVLAHLRARGAKVPECFGYSRNSGFPMCAMEFVRGDETAASDASLGRALRGVHAAGPWPGSEDLEAEFKTKVLECVAQWLRKLVSRRRLDVSLTRAVGPALFDGWRAPRLTTLHMDFRRDNVVSVKNGVAAVLDWGNAMAGDPWLDLLRVEEYAELEMGAFWSGYGEAPPRPPAGIERLYRLYTTSMLALLFEKMAPNPEKCGIYAERTISHLSALR